MDKSEWQGPHRSRRLIGLRGLPRTRCEGDANFRFGGGRPSRESLRWLETELELIAWEASSRQWLRLRSSRASHQVEGRAVVPVSAGVAELAPASRDAAMSDFVRWSSFRRRLRSEVAASEGRKPRAGSDSGDGSTSLFVGKTLRVIRGVEKSLLEAGSPVKGIDGKSPR